MGRNDHWSEKDLRAAFFKMVYTLGLWIFFMMVTIFLGIIKDWAFFDSSHVHGWQHVVFFIWLIGALIVLLWVTIVRIWHIDELFRSTYGKKSAARLKEQKN